MDRSRHGISIGLERQNNDFYLYLKAVGKLTHADYQIITPMIDKALEGVEQAKIKVLIDGTELQGWEARAAWDDFKLGLKHGAEFEQIAIVGNKKWQEFVSKLAAWFISGEVKFFETEDEALGWLNLN